MIALLAAAVGLGTAPVATNPAMWFRAGEYPAPAALKGEGGRVQIEVTVDDTGAPVGCSVVGSSGTRVLDTASCQVAMKRGNFRPALDEDGRAVFGIVKKSFNYQAVFHNPKTDWTDYTLTLSRLPVISGDGVAVLRIVTDAAGKVETCVVDTSSGAAALDRLACGYTRSTIVLAPPLDRDGQPVRALRLTRVGFTAAPAP